MRIALQCFAQALFYFVGNLKILKRSNTSIMLDLGSIDGSNLFNMFETAGKNKFVRFAKHWNVFSMLMVSGTLVFTCVYQTIKLHVFSLFMIFERTTTKTKTHMSWEMYSTRSSLSSFVAEVRSG